MPATIIEILEVMTKRLDNTNDRVDNVNERIDNFMNFAEAVEKYLLLNDSVNANQLAKLNELADKVASLDIKLQGLYPAPIREQQS